MSKLSTVRPTDSIMSSIGEHTEASSIQAELGRVRDDECHSPLSEVVVASADTGIRQVSARASVMVACEALMAYASVARTDNDRESAHWAQPSKLRQSNWATAVGYRMAPNVGPYLAE